MTALILVFASLLLFLGFVLLTQAEARRGRRYFEGARSWLDRRAESTATRASRADVGAAIASGVRRGSERVAHDAAHISLIAVRAAERGLTHTVRSLRTKRAEKATAAAPASFASTMKDFKNELRNGNSTNETGADAPTEGNQ